MPPSHDSTSTSLLLRLKSQDEAAWERFVGVYGPLVMSWIRRWFIAHDQMPHDQEDIAQDVFATVHRYIADFDRARTGSFRKWLHRVVDSRTDDFCDKNNRNEPTLSETQLDALHKILDPASPINATNDDDDENEADKAEERRLLIQAIINTIKTDFRAETWLAFYETAVNGLSAKEVAAKLGISPIAVRQARRRVKQRIEDEFGDMME